jgi:tRNA-Thr(GGU) m(6)t(6)A37 methyltransferase TsaA
MKKIIYTPIGIIHSPFKQPKGVPIQPTAAKGIKGEVEVFKEYADGLKNLEGFSHIILIYHFHLSEYSGLSVKPYMDTESHGVFATRAPSRPNSIGLSIVTLDKIEDNILFVRDIDIVEGTPLVDIKPFVPQFDIREVDRIGWLDKNIKKLRNSKDDGRFLK